MKSEFKASVLEQCTLVPDIGEIYIMLTPMQLRRGFIRANVDEWEVVRVEDSTVTITHRRERQYLSLRMVLDIKFPEWRDKLATGELRYVTHDP